MSTLVINPRLKTAYRSFAFILGFLVLFTRLFQVLTSPDTTDVLAEFVQFFSYFTIEVNAIASFTMFFSVIRPQGIANSPKFRGALVVYITIVAIVYHAVLAKLFHFEGSQWWLDQGFHTALPILFVLDWILFSEKSGLRWRDAAYWMIFPLAYCLYSMVRGSIIGRYPYPFLDPNQSSVTQVIINIIGLVVVFYAGSLLVISLRSQK